MNLYSKTAHKDIKEECLTWINQRSFEYTVHNRTWQELPTRDLIRATHNLVYDELLPIGWTKAKSLLPINSEDTDVTRNFKSTLGLEYFNVLNKTNLPLGNLDDVLYIIRKKWFDDFGAFGRAKIKLNHENGLFTTVLKTICTDMQDTTKNTLRASDNFKLLLLYTAYQTTRNQEEWFADSGRRFPDIDEMPLAALTLVYPEYQDQWSIIQEKILNRAFDRADTFQLIAKVLFNKDFTFSSIESLCESLETPVEQFFETLKTTGPDIFLPDNMDFYSFEA